MVDRVFVCSPYRGNIKRNVAVAKAICHKAIKRGLVPFASHLLYPQLLDDNKPEDRKIGLLCAKAFLIVCQYVWVYKDAELSSGMKDEISCAKIAKIPIEYIKLNEEEIAAALDR